jgi:cysteinyl-tRNA synthetase
VHDVVALTVLGAGVDEVCRSFPNVTRAQVYECLAYYEDHRGEIDALVAARTAARAARDFAEADRLRGELTARGVEIMDGAGGSTWRRIG